MRIAYLSTLVILALVLGLMIWQSFQKNRLLSLQRQDQTLTLTDLPRGYCPTVVKVANKSKLDAGRLLSVKDCRVINVGLLGSSISADDQVFFKLPKALPFSLKAESLLAAPASYAPELGDVNEDAVIDGIDEELALNGLFSTDTAADLDGDKEVTVLDLSLIRLHQGLAYTTDKAGLINWQAIK